jgi:hypothetical protein
MTTSMSLPVEERKEMQNAVVELHDKTLELLRLFQDSQPQNSPESLPKELREKINFLKQKYSNVAIEVLFFLVLLHENKDKISCFEKLLYEHLGDELSVLIVINNAPDEQCDLIYDLQWMVFEKFSDVLIDFRLLERCNIPLEKLIICSDSVIHLS